MIHEVVIVHDGLLRAEDLRVRLDPLDRGLASLTAVERVQVQTGWVVFSNMNRTAGTRDDRLV